MRLSLAIAAALLLSGCKLDGAGTGTDDPFAVVVDSAGEDATIDASVDRDSADDAAPNDGALDVAEVAPEVDGADDVSDTLDAPPACTESGAVRWGGHCYFLAPALRTFAAARTSCEMRSPPAHLVSITSAEEHEVVRALGAGTDRWIGLSKPTAAPAVRASFGWTTGESSLGYDGWAPSDPDGGFDCARLRTDGLWADFACATEFASVCERE